MNGPKKPMPDPRKKIVLFIDDDEDDFLLFKDIFRESYPDIELHWIKDGEEAIANLLPADGSAGVAPLFIFLDLNMPKLNGKEVLRQLRSHDGLDHVPIAVFTNSNNRDEAIEAYRLGANSFIRKPSGYKELREFISTFHKYWFEYSTLL
jgi:two-component system response regulator